MSGLIDAPWHAFMAATPKMALMTAQSSYLQLLAAREGGRRHAPMKKALTLRSGLLGCYGFKV